MHKKIAKSIFSVTLIAAMISAIPLAIIKSAKDNAPALLSIANTDSLPYSVTDINVTKGVYSLSENIKLRYIDMQNIMPESLSNAVLEEANGK